MSALALQFLLGLTHHLLYVPTLGYVPWWTKLHRVLGYLIVGLGIAQIGIGINYFGLTMYWYIIYGVYAGIVLIIFGSLWTNKVIKWTRVEERDMESTEK